MSTAAPATRLSKVCERVKSIAGKRENSEKRERARERERRREKIIVSVLYRMYRKIGEGA